MAARTRRDWGGKDEKAFLRMLEQGHSMAAIARVMKTTAKTLRRNYRSFLEAHEAGRLAQMWTTEQRGMVQAMVGLGLTQADISNVMGISVDVLKRDFNEELRTGQPLAHMTIANSLFAAARGGDVNAMKFYLARQCGWREEIDVRARVKTEGTVEHTVAAPDARESLRGLSKDGREHMRLALGDLGVRSAVVDEGPREDEVIH